MDEETIEELIYDFLKESAYVVNCLYKRYGRKDLLRACIDGTIERSGKLEGLERYAFHGIGLYAKRRHCEVDFDFGPHDRIDGFDSWRLSQFAKSRKHSHKQWDQEKIQSELNRLEIEDKISKLENDLSSNYYKT